MMSEIFNVFCVAIVWFIIFLNFHELALQGLGFKRAYSIAAIMAFMVFYAAFLRDFFDLFWSIFFAISCGLASFAIAASIFFQKKKLS